LNPARKPRALARGVTGFTLIVPPEQSGARLDVFLAGHFASAEPCLSRSAIKKIILEGGVSCAGVALDKPHYKVKAQEELRVRVPEKGQQGPAAEDIPLKVVYEDDDLAVVDKPSGMVVHPAPGNLGRTLVNALLHRFKQLSDINPGRPGIVHRLDKEASGLLVVAKNNAAHLNLAKQFARHSVKRKYLAVVKGEMEFDQRIIEAPVGRHPFKRQDMAVSFSAGSRYAKTYCRTLQRGKDYSLVELELFTGRTHQIRVHMKFIGHPVLGDAKYGGAAASLIRKYGVQRLCLHAAYLGFTHPATGKFVEFFSPHNAQFPVLTNVNTGNWAIRDK
jgi:23S rRNA pseudouridine1911/1915/1917 synthase